MITQESTDPVKESPTRVNDVTREMAEKNTTPDITIEPNTDSVLTPKKQSISALFITTPTHQNAQIKSARNIETPSTDLPIRIRRAIRKRSGSLPSPTSILLPNTGLLFSKTPSASRPPSRPSSRATTPTHVPDHTPISRKRIKKLPSTFIKYLQSELSVEYATDAEETIPESPKQAIDEQVRKNVYNLLHVPLELEKVRFSLHRLTNSFYSTEYAFVWMRFCIISRFYRYASLSPFIHFYFAQHALKMHTHSISSNHYRSYLTSY
jgi:hypothetical protein